MFRIACALLLAALSVPAPAAAADRYPQKPIRLIVPFPPGGGTDLLARALSAKFEEDFGHGFVIENRSGASGTIGTAVAARAAPDGYTLLLSSAAYTFTPSLYKDLSYDPLKDFKPITNFAFVPNVLVVHPSMPVKSVKELIALAHRRPGEIHFGSAGRGSNIHLTTELFNYMARIKVTHVPYKGGGPGVVAVISGEIQMLIPAINSAVPFLRSGRMRGLGVTTKQRSPAMPELPPIHEAGVPGYDKAAWFGLFAPSGVPDAVIDRVHRTAARILKSPEIAKRLLADGAMAVGNTPAEFDKFVRDELAAWRKLIDEMKL